MGLDCYEFGIMKVTIKFFFTVQVLDFGGKKLQLLFAMDFMLAG